MASGYRSTVGGVKMDFDDLFDPYVQGAKSAATGRRVAGVDLNQRYAHISYGSKRANVGHRVADVDVSNFWAAKGTASYSLPFDGQSYSASSEAPTGGTAAPTAALSLTIASNGTWSISRNVSGSAAGNGSTTLASGTWLPAGQSASDYQVQFVGTASGGGAVTNGATAYQACTTSRSIQLQASVPAASSQNMQAVLQLGCNLRRVSTGTVNRSDCAFSCSALGFV